MVQAIALLIIGMLSIQFGATVAKQLFTVVDPAVVTMVRTSFAAVFLLILLRPWRAATGRRSWLRIALYGSTLGIMNLLFYLSLRRIPLGLAVALEFTGPLGVALLGSKHKRDFVWVLLAGLGIALLLPIGVFDHPLDPWGILLALSAGLCWGLYIIFGKQVVLESTAMQGATWGMVFAALVTLPFGMIHINQTVLSDATWFWKACLVAIFSSALPYSLEMIVMKRMDQKTFGTLMSIEPALAAAMGFVFLGEILTTVQMLALVFIILACLGATHTAARPDLPAL